MPDLIVNGELVLYGPVGFIDWWEGSGFTSDDVVRALARMEGDITVRLNSGGGVAMEGSAIYNALKRYAGAVAIVVDGIAASAASVIAMAGDTVEMPLGSMMMIHEPAGITLGPADEHRHTAGVLDSMTGVYAELYADATGLPEAEIRALMKAETWLSPSEAVDLGFATAEIATEDPVTADISFDYGTYRNAPASLSALSRNRKAKGLPMVAVMSAPQTTRKETAMPKSNPAPADDPTTATNPSPTAATPQAAAPAAAPASNVVADIYARCTMAGMTLAEANKIVKDADGSMDAAVDAILATVAKRDPDGGAVSHQATVTADARDRFKEGAQKALLARAGLEGGEANEFSAMSLRELARESLSQAGITMSFRDPMTMVAAALGMPTGFTMAGQNSTSDFVEILGNTANKSMMKGYQEAPETFDRWTSRGTLPDFKAAKRVDLNLFPSLTEVPEGAEYSSATIGERAETIQLATYGKLFPITRQAIINDDLSAFSRIPQRMGRAARRTIGNLAYAVLTDNAALADGTALFHADHNNLASSGAAPSVTTVSAGRAAMAKQVDPDSVATGGLNIRPAFALVPVELEDTMMQVINSEFDPAKTQRATNTVRNAVREIIADARLSTASATAWYLAADPAMFDTVEVSYLNGVDAPTLERRDGWDVDGVEFKVRIDAGVKALGHVGLYKDPGT